MFNDFQKQEDIKFDIIKLRQALKQVVEKKGFDDAITFETIDDAFVIVEKSRASVSLLKNNKDGIEKKIPFNENFNILRGFIHIYR